jgi:hypothetical protein
LGGRKKYSLASFGLRGGLCDFQECIFLVRCLYFGLCQGIFVERNARIEMCYTKSVEQIEISEKCQAKNMQRHTRITDCYVNIVERTAKCEKGYGNFDTIQ